MTDGVNTTKLAELVEKKREKQSLDAAASKLSKEIVSLEAQLLEQFADTGVTKMTINGATVYRRSQLWAAMKEGETDALVAALREGEFASQTTINHSSFSSLVRELLEQWEVANNKDHADMLDLIREGAFDWEQVCPGWGQYISVTERVTLNKLEG